VEKICLLAAIPSGTAILSAISRRGPDSGACLPELQNIDLHETHSHRDHRLLHFHLAPRFRVCLHERPDVQFRGRTQAIVYYPLRLYRLNEYFHRYS
jgi:hypothetical protein